jgi:hypothetical protein
MKKLFTLVAVAFMALGANAQAVIAEADFTTAESFNGWTQFDASQEEAGSKVELVAGEGLAITVASQTGQLWQPQIMVIGDGSFNLLEDGNYKVIVNAKFPTAGQLQINMGTWSANDQAAFDVPESADFQEVECLFEGWGKDMEGSHLLFQCGDFLGVTTLAKIQVIDLDAEPTGIKTLNNKAQNGVRYNLAGQKVDANYKGAVIMNGKKFIQK